MEGESSPPVVEKRKKKLLDFFESKDKYILGLWAILIIGFIIRISHFLITKGQPLWWDESDYLAYAKNLAGLGGNWIITDNHISIFPYAAALLFKLGLGEASLKFILVLIPSMLLIYLTYLVCLKMYDDKRIALVSAFITATLWSLLWNSTRFHVGIPALVLAMLAIYVYFQGYQKGEKVFGKINPKWSIPLAVLFVVLSYGVRRAYFLFGLFFLIHMFLTKPIKSLVKDKYNWIALGIAVVLLLLLEKVIFPFSVGDVAGSYYHPEQAFNWKHLQIFGAYFSSTLSPSLSILTYLFYIGIILVAINVFLSLGYFKKIKNISVKSDLWVAIAIIVTLSYFIFYQRGTNFGEPRWYFTLLFASILCVSRGAVWVTDKIKPYNKHIALILLIVMIGFGGYYQYERADSLIKNRVNSFDGIRQAGFYLKDVATDEDIIISVARPQPIYYSEKQVLAPWEFLGVPNSETTLEQFLEEIRKPENSNVNFILVSFSEGNHPPWMLQLTNSAAAIPFMETAINIQTGQQDIKQEKTYDDITFNLLKITGDTFIYRINRA